MKLDTTTINIETSDGLEGKAFAIGDAGLLFDILRSKMYSNPILAICREYICNAIDSHREVSKPDQPVQVCLPNDIEPYYKVKDFGVGISPDRMEHIFIKYGSSTKREDNIQGGSFGLGAKCAFSMVDSFAVNTIYNGIAYKYACVIDETKIGKLYLLSKFFTKENNGTEIVIPVEPKDFKAFNTWTETIGRHLQIKPIIKGGTISWQTPKLILEGNGWAIAAAKDEYHRQAKMIIDGIEYPLVLNSLRTYADTKLIDACRGDIIMYFGIGELTLSASREQIYLDKKTQDKIKHRLEDIQNEIKKLLLDKIDTFPNLWLACVYYRKELSAVFNDLRFFGKLNWKTIDLHNGIMSVSCPIFTFNRGKYNRKTGNDPNKLTRSRMHSIYFEENSEIFINDLSIKEPTPRHVKKAFEDNPNLNSIQVLCPTDTITEEYLNKSIHLDKMEPRKISEITKARGRAYTASSARLLIFKFDPLCSQYRQVSYSSIDEDTNDKVLCLLGKDYAFKNRNPFIKNNNSISLASMKSIAEKNAKISFYGIDRDLPTNRVEEEFGDFEPFETYLDTHIINNKTINYIELKFAIDNSYYIDKYLLANLPFLKEKINNPNSSFLTRADLHQKIKDINSGDIGLLQVYESIKGEITEAQTKQFLKNNPGWDLEAINRECTKTYPLLGLLQNYHTKNMIDHVAHYINLIDAYNKDQKKTN